MELPNTTENRVLASAVNARIKSDARLLNARAALYRLAGIGILCALTGVGIGAAFYGYSYANDPTFPTAKVANAVAEALQKVTFKTEGTVKLDPESAIAVNGGRSDVPTPTPAQLGAGAVPESKAAVLTNFTVFKNVPYGSGQVVTGWNFTSSEQKSPSHQYCYYSEQIDGTSKVTIDLGENGRPLPQAKARTNVDPAVAYTNCVWFRSGAI
ncbi:hypothetical protein [Enterovirga aerilata]|uniref:Uncharacterized protein n=1 Tax=Enterovirga aerilata TaxID=2730920 RepID=A0A849I588_9HYPH|nr:hypothetical protein [Enterovirga sp. DB1703]NNM71217.1 hypothetical protein [Enterovirga sp. DB1703]